MLYVGLDLSRKRLGGTACSRTASGSMLVPVRLMVTGSPTIRPIRRPAPAGPIDDEPIGGRGTDRGRDQQPEGDAVGVSPGRASVSRRTP
jgi:hypothetical protein